METLASSLKKDRIHLIFRQNTQGLVYGITYVDHTTKCVFNGSDRGKSYGAKAIRERCHPTQVIVQELKQSQSFTIKQETTPLQGGKMGDVVNELLQAEENNQMIASELRQEELRRWKRKRLLGRIVEVGQKLQTTIAMTQLISQDAVALNWRTRR